MKPKIFHFSIATVLLLVFTPARSIASEPWEAAFSVSGYTIRAWELAPDGHTLLAVRGNGLGVTKFDLDTGTNFDSGTTSVLSVGFPQTHPEGIYLCQDGGNLVAGNCGDFSPLWSTPLPDFYGGCSDYGLCLQFGEAAVGRDVVLVQTIVPGTLGVYSLADGSIRNMVPIPGIPDGPGREKLLSSDRLLSLVQTEGFLLLGTDRPNLKAICQRLNVPPTGIPVVSTLFQVEGHMIGRDSAFNPAAQHLALPAGGKDGRPGSYIYDTDYRVLIYGTNGVQLHSIGGFDSEPTAVSYTPDGGHFLVASGNRVSIYDVNNSYALFEAPIQLGAFPIIRLAATNDLMRIVTASSVSVGIVTLWIPPTP